VTHPIQSADHVLERLAGLPGGPELLAQARRREDVALVGGAVRDLLLGHWPRELDVTVAADAAGLARELAASVSPGERAYGRPVEPVLHERFGTASIAWQYGRIDVAERRAEAYPSPGALPEVRAGSFEEDLRRRDFTVNAISLPLHGPDAEGLLAVDGALEDLHAGLLRVLHERSFLDDPTRILRLARYAARLRFEIEPETLRLAREAVAAGALDTVSGGRIGNELWLAVAEASGPAALTVLDELGVLTKLGVGGQFEATLAHEAAALLPAGGSTAALLMGLALRTPGPVSGPSSADSLELFRRLEFSGEQVKAVAGIANGLDGIADVIERCAAREAPLELDEHSAEAVAAAGALAARSNPQAAEIVREWFTTHRHAKLEIDGADLLAAGVPEGPEVGARLRAALSAKRRGRAHGREDELRAALDAEVHRGTPIETGP
jgi:tRNA nucleotidyltransferase (CCA-adding enzyme)